MDRESLTSSFLLTRSRLADGRGTLGIFFFGGASESVEMLVLRGRSACELIIRVGVSNFGVNLAWVRF